MRLLLSFGASPGSRAARPGRALPRLLLDTIDDLVGIVDCVVHVLVSQLAEFIHELLLQLRRAVTDLLFERVVKPHLKPPAPPAYRRTGRRTAAGGRTSRDSSSTSACELACAGAGLAVAVGERRPRDRGGPMRRVLA